MKGLFFLLLAFISLNLAGQDRNEGRVTIIQDSRVDSLVEKYISANALYPQLKGWRVEIFFEAGNFSKRMAMEARAGFVEKHPEIPSYLIFHQPYYKVRVGDFYTKMEAEQLLRKIERDYPNAFVVNDDINFPRLR